MPQLKLSEEHHVVQDMMVSPTKMFAVGVVLYACFGILIYAFS